MKLLFRIVPVTLVVAAMFVAVSCKKNVAGTKGEPGAPGTPGDNGNLRIYNTTYAATSWSLNGNEWESHFSTEKISGNVLTKGEVEVYMQLEGDWWTLPYGVGDFFMQASVEQNWVHLKYFKIHGGPPPKP